jgi:ketopantoate reductase
MEAGGAASMTAEVPDRKIHKTRKCAPPHDYIHYSSFKSDYLGRMQEIRYPDGEVVRYGYGYGGQITAVG